MTKGESKHEIRHRRRTFYSIQSFAAVAGLGQYLLFAGNIPEAYYAGARLDPALAFWDGAYGRDGYHHYLYHHCLDKAS
jgi:hypothetical protein